MADRIPVHGRIVIRQILEAFGLDDDPDAVDSISLTATRVGDTRLTIVREARTEDGRVSMAQTAYGVVELP